MDNEATGKKTSSLPPAEGLFHCDPNRSIIITGGRRLIGLALRPPKAANFLLETYLEKFWKMSWCLYSKKLERSTN